MTHANPSQRTLGGTHLFNRQVQLFTLVATLLALAVLAAATAPRAVAISDAEELAQFGNGVEGSSQAGQLSGPFGIATDPLTGHVYVADSFNKRVSEFTPWGNFVKAFGWDVAPGAVNEQQEVRVRASGGQFKLIFGTSTSDLAFDAPGSASEGPGSVEAALNALPAIGGVGGEVSVEAVPGTPDGKTPFIYVVTFKGSLAGSNVGQLTVANGTTPLSGGSPSTTLEARTRADGTAGGTGLESCTAESGCKAGIAGAGAGEFSNAFGIAADTAGNLYVREDAGGNNRVQKFDPAGRFLLMFGGEVNKTKTIEGKPEAERNRCTKAQLEGGDECGIGTAGSGQGQFGTGFSSGIAFAVDKLFVADVERIQRFNTEGEYEASVPVSGKTVFQLAVAPGSGDFYASVGDANVRKLDSTTGAEIGKLEGTSSPVATDPAGNVYAVREREVRQFDSEGKPLSPPSCCDSGLFGLSITGLGTNAVGDLYVAYRKSAGVNFIRSFGPGPVAFEAAPKLPPTITAQFATTVGRNDATVAVEINPHFWSDTRYYVQYGTGKCSEGGCETKPLPPGATLSPKTVNVPLKSAGIPLEGLQAGTTYHYRFVAESSGGGPVRGIGGEVGVDGEESTFTTYPAPIPSKTNCPNQAFRTGFSAPLPDCRAFEMVSPVDKNNGDIKSLLDLTNYSTALSRSALDGSGFTYSSYRSFGAPKGAPYANQYLATRKDGVGWSSEALAPAQVTSPLGADSLENRYKAFSADLCQSWLVAPAEPVLAPGAPPGFNEIYRHDGCGKEGYEALIQVEPSVSIGAFIPILQGSSTDGREAIFTVADKLSEEAAADSIWQAYYASEGQLRLLCILPNGSASGSHCSVGTGPGRVDVGPQTRERYSSVTHAISADGSKVYWTDSGSDESGPGKVYLRLNPGEEQSEVSGGVCTEAEKACTLKVSETASSKASRFLGASADGSKALFQITEGAQAGNLYLFDSENSTLLAGKGLGVAGTSEDLSHIYFVSEEALPETSGATAGKPNLYLDQEGTRTFIATLSKSDGGNIAAEPVFHAARATADGSHLAFTSTESLTGYDNTDQASGKADSEVYLYGAGSSGPVCLSCNPSGARPAGLVVASNGFKGSLPTAASLAMPESSLYSPRVLSADGKRLFFNSFDPLLPRDTNGKADVYEWEAASSAKECKEKGAELYVESSGGCLSLISSGQSPSDAEFLDSSENGGDAFFTTNSSLLPQDPGLVDVYDARANGGLPAPPEPPGPCQGEACQFAPPPPNDPTPASASFKGAGNLKPRSRCAKGKVARKGRCVAKKRKRATKRHNGKRAANHNREVYR